VQLSGLEMILQHSIAAVQCDFIEAMYTCTALEVCAVLEQALLMSKFGLSKVKIRIK